MHWFRMLPAVVAAAMGMLTTFLFSPNGGRSEDRAPQRTYGYIEWAEIPGEGIRLTAKLDTGADQSSLHARTLLFDKDGEPWVRFTVTDALGVRRELIRRVEGFVTVKPSRGLGTRRPVVYLPLCIGDIRATVPVNLADRSQLTHPLLIGRNFLEKGILVTSSETFLSTPRCP